MKRLQCEAQQQLQMQLNGARIRLVGDPEPSLEISVAETPECCWTGADGVVATAMVNRQTPIELMLWVTNGFMTEVEIVVYAPHAPNLLLPAKSVEALSEFTVEFDRRRIPHGFV